MKNKKLDTITTKLKNLVKDSNPESPFPSKLGITAIMVLGLVSAIIQFPKDAKDIEETTPQESMDSMIPSEESLVPIQVSNYESLDQIIGNFGVVDLYSTPLDPSEKPKKIAYAVKLIRTSQTPGHFSVLVDADQAYKLAGIQGEFTAVVRNPKLIGTKFVNKQARSPKRRVIYHWEE